MNVSSSHDALWHRRLDALQRAWPGFLDGDVDALHKVRVASRRIREALPVIGVDLPRARIRKLRRRVGRLTRLLGPIRELDVELGLIEREIAEKRTPRAALSLVRRQVAEHRAELREQLDDETPVKDLKRLLKKLRRVGRHKGEEGKGEGPGGRGKGKGVSGKGRGARGATETVWRPALAATLVRRARKLSDALEEAGSMYSPEPLHAVRVSVKKLRYTLELSDELGYPSARPLVRILKSEQERLGQLHDFEMLLRHVREAESRPRGIARLSALDEYAESLERECRRVHAGFMEGRGALLDAIRQVRLTLVPALTAAHRRPARATAVRAQMPAGRRVR